MKSKKSEKVKTLELTEVNALVKKDFEINQASEDILSEEALIQIISAQIDYLIKNETERLFAILYRLDIDERSVRFALIPAPGNDPPITIAKLIIERQKEKAQSRLLYRQRKKKDGTTEW
jgi:hypothetical protein